MNSPVFAGAPAAAAAPPALNLSALHAWAQTHLPGWPAAAQQVQASRVTGGQSNPTWLLQIPGARAAWVLRAKPGPAAQLLPSAHAIEREFRVLQALQGTAVPVPPVLGLCEDESLLGASFYVMGFVAGRIVREVMAPDWSATDRAAFSDQALRVLAALHAVDWRAQGLTGFGREDAFFERQIARWTRQYRASLTTGAMPAMEALANWLPQHLPQGPAAQLVTLTHGDFRLENLIFDPQRPQVLAVLDWELSTLGHPYSDLAYHAMAWHLPVEPLRGYRLEAEGGSGNGSGVASEVASADDSLAPGIPSLREAVAGYLRYRHPLDNAAQHQARLDELAADWQFYLALNLFRLAAILQGIARRVADGTAAHPQAVRTAAQASVVAELGWSVASGQRSAW